MKAVILAGGLGTRLRPFTEIIPKPLLPIGERSVLEIQIESLRKHGFDEILLATNYKTEYIKRFFQDGADYGVKLIISKEEIPLGTAGPLTLLKKDLTEPFLVMNGDILTQLDFSKFKNFALKEESLLSIAIKRLITPFAFGNIHFNGKYITDLEEKPNIERYILAGIYFMKPELLELIPENTYFGMDKLIKTMLEKKLPVTKYEMNEYWLDIGQITEFENAQSIYNRYFKEV